MLRIPVIIEPDPLAHWVSVRPELPGHCLVDDRDGSACWSVSLVKTAPTVDRDTHCTEETTADHIEGADVPLAGTRVRVAFYSEGLACPSSQERRVGVNGDLLNAR